MNEMVRKREVPVLVLQGGGALGAYQAGAYQVLAESGHVPEWIAGISIGAINSAIIAGNRPDQRVGKLRAFWDLVSSHLLAPPTARDGTTRQIFNESSAAIAASFGIPGFFKPRCPPAILSPKGTPEAISFYDTAPLRATLLDLVDFDLLNSGAVRLSVGAVQVRTGNMKYFDTAYDTITPEHIMASGALPPGFPPIAIDGEPYWDGGIVSNTPLQYVLDGTGSRQDMCIFQIDLFNKDGPLPQTLFDIELRAKDIRFSSRTRLNTDMARELQTVRRALRRLSTKLPETVRDDADWKLLAAFSCDAAITVVQLIHRRAAYWTQSTDYEFSRTSINEHWEAGSADVEQTLKHPDWIKRKRPDHGVNVLDLTRDGVKPIGESDDKSATAPGKRHWPVLISKSSLWWGTND